MKRYYINENELVVLDMDNNSYTQEFLFNSSLTAVYKSTTKSIFDIGWKNIKDFQKHLRLFSYKEIAEPQITTWINPNTNEEFKKYIFN